MPKISIFFFSILALVSFANAFAKQYQTPRFASRSEYRACLDEEEKLKPQLAAKKIQLLEHNDKLKILQDEIDAHVATQSSIDITERAAVDAFNIKMDSLNQRGKELNELAEIFNKEQQDLNNKIAALNKRCAAIVVSFEDIKAVAKERAGKAK